ncbi:MAG: hypothetical protein AAGI69_23965 [Cyanobacteria bacterium P01_H01_bin.21]
MLSLFRREVDKRECAIADKLFFDSVWFVASLKTWTAYIEHME